MQSEAWDPESCVSWFLALRAFEHIRATTKPDIGVAVCDEEDLKQLTE